MVLLICVLDIRHRMAIQYCQSSGYSHPSERNSDSW